MAVDCFEKHGFGDTQQRPNPVKEYLLAEAEKYGDDTNAQVRAIKDLQHDILDSLHNTYHELGVEGFERPAEGMIAVDPETEAKINKALEDDTADPGTTVPPPPAAADPTLEDTQDNPEEWTAIRKAEITDGVKLAQRGFDTGGVVTREESVQSGLRRLAAEGSPTKSLYENAADKVTGWADRIINEIRTLGKSLFNPNDEELAQMLYHRTATQQRMSEIYDKMNSDSDTERRLAVAEFQGLMDELVKVDYVLNETGRVGGRAFGFKQYEGRLDPEYGLQIRRMELAARKEAPLTDEELSWVFDQWQKERDLNQREFEARQQGMQEEFDKKIVDLHKDYEQKLKDAAKGKKETSQEKREKTLSEKGADLAAKLRRGKLKGGTYGTFPGVPQAINAVIEAIAQIVDKGASLAEAIQKFVADNGIKDKDKFTDDFFIAIDRQEKRADSLDRIKDNAQLNKVSGITPEMVSKNMIRDYVDSHIGEVDAKDVLNKSFEGLKEELPALTKDELLKAYLKEGEYKQPTKAELENDFKKDKAKIERLAKIEKDLSDLKEQKDIYKRGNNKSKERKVDSDIEATEKRLKKEMSDHGVKYSNEDKFAKASYETRAKSHNDRVDNVAQKIKDKANDPNLTPEQKARVEKLNASIDQAKITLNPNSKLSQKQMVDAAPVKLRQIISEFNRDMKMDDRRKLADVSRSLQALLDKFDADKNDSEQTVKLQRTKERLRNDNAERQRKLNSGEFEEEVSKPLTKSDAELIKIQRERNKIESDYRKKQKELEDKNRTFLQRTFKLTRAAYVAGLIYKFGTLAKVLATSLIRPNIEALTKGTFGNLFKALFPNFAYAAKGGGESSSWRSIAGMYGAYFKQMGAEKMEKIYDKSNTKYETSALEYNRYVKDMNGVQPDKFQQKEIDRLKAQMHSDLIDAQANILYKFIGGSSIEDAWDAFVYRSNRIEREFGYSDVETYGTDVKGASYLAKSLGKEKSWEYLFNTFGRLHSAVKTFSGRANFAGGFIARLESAVADGVDITKPDRILEIANESYLDWERGKYQQANFVTDVWNSVTRGIEKYDEGGEWTKYSQATSELLKFDVAITRVPVNIIHEAVAEYTVGAFTSFWKMAQEVRKAKKQVLMNDNLLPETKEFKDAVKEQLRNMDKKQAATIARCFRKGGFGMGLLAFSMISTMVNFGGFHHKGEKKKKESDLGEDETNPGEIMFGNNRVGKLVSAIIEHQPAAFPSLLGLNYAKVKQEQIERGETTFSAAMDGALSDLEAIQDAIPQTKIINPIQITKDIAKSGLRQIDSFWESGDVDENGDLITRKPLNMTDQFNLVIGRRGKVLTEANYKTALSIKRTYTTAIQNAHKTGASQEEIDNLIKERNDLIDKLYEEQ